MDIVDGGKVLFSEAELRCKGTGILKLAPGFDEELKSLRLNFGRPMVVNSCCRAPSHNARVGGHPRSLHLTEGGRETGGTCAIDISRNNLSQSDEVELVQLALAAGWSVGVHVSFFHLDLRSKYTGLSQNIFNY